MFGRKTYEMMSSFWPSRMAADTYPVVAEKMNTSTKFVVSNSLKEATWQNSSILNGDIIQEIKKLKANTVEDIIILGSGSIISLLSQSLLIDEYEFMIDPVALSEGESLFHHIESHLKLKLVEHKVFPLSGSILLKYVPITS
ncbi:MAG TPA: dihydrofolate reductase family protein [Bacteroidia bacterium]|nr:dihydrofolate reductase family protein [Bacteroidia bacterium]